MDPGGRHCAGRFHTSGLRSMGDIEMCLGSFSGSMCDLEVMMLAEVAV